MWGYVSLAIVAMAAGIMAILRVTAAVTPAAPTLPAARSAGQDLLIYRNAVLAYAEVNPNLGMFADYPVPNSLLTYPAGVSSSDIPPQAGNLITPGPNGARIIYAWMPAPRGAVSQTTSALGGDLTIGRIEGPGWVTPALGAMGSIPSPSTMPTGDIISVIEIGG